ncbi:serine hydrolase [Leptolyngbya sp. 15MV]|nr:serine hydrolase [Leptolyngbya sp. 15MV]
MIARSGPLIAMLALLPTLAGCSGEPAAPAPLSEAARAAVAEDAGAPSEQLARQIDDLFTNEAVGETRAVIVMHGGRIVAERYAPGYDAETRFVSWSMAKTMTAVMIGMLVADGRLHLDESPPVPRWQRPGDPRGEITLRQLLQMRAGLDDRPRRRRAGDGRQHDLTGRPADVRLLALIELARSPLMDALERADRVADLREVRAEDFAVLQLRLDRLEHPRRVLLVRSNERHELAMPVEERPQARHLAQARLTRAARHRHREQPALEHRLFDLGDDLQVVVGPLQMERLPEVRLAEEPEVLRGPRAPHGVRDGRQVADVAPREREHRVAESRPLLHRLVAREPLGRACSLRQRLVPRRHQPCDVAEQVDLARVTVGRDAEPRARAVPVELSLVDHLAEMRAVEQPRELAGLELARVNPHRCSSPLPATRRSARG